MSSHAFPKKTVRDIPIHDTRVLLRADFNVPMSKDGTISSDYRITQTLPTIQYLLERHCEVVIISHLGRPEGKPNKKYSLEPVATYLAELLQQPVDFVSDSVGDVVVQSLKKLTKGKITVLENVRFHPGEEANDPVFAKHLIASIKPSYIVHDEFGAVHRAHASTEAISHLVPAVAGLLLEKEVTILSEAMEAPKRPLVAVLGGAKISDKLPLVERFLEKADTILVGGAMANNFTQAAGHPVGKSLIDAEGADQITAILGKAKLGQLKVPLDAAVGTEVSSEATRRDCGLDDVGESDVILDLGFETMRTYTEVLQSASTVIWNGTLGMTELPQFAQASEVMAQMLSDNNQRLDCIVGGGDTADFVLSWLEKHPEGVFKHISTGGGASLELMSGVRLPGVEALLDI